MAKAIAASPVDRISRYLHNLDFTSPFFTSGALAIFKRYGPVGLIAATVGGYALKRHLSRANHAGNDVDAEPKARKGKKAKHKK